MSEPQPLVSIVMPVLNATPFLAQAIDSVLAQVYPHWELLIVDDGSTDASALLAAAYAARARDRIRFLRHENPGRHGASASRNVGLARARGELVTFLDADDVWLPEHLARQAERMHAVPDVGVLYSRTMFWHSWKEGPDRPADHTPPHLVPSDRVIEGPDLLERCLAGRASVPCTCSLLVRRSLIDEVGGWEERFTHLYTDQAFYSKLFLSSRVLPIEGCWAWYRQHPGSSTGSAQREHRARTARLEFLTWLDDYLDHRPGIPPSLRAVVRRELWRCGHPVADYLLDRLTYIRREFDRLTARR